MKYSLLNLARQALNNHKDWPQSWPETDLKSSYDAVIIGGGGHGLATAYYLASEHKMTNIAVLEKGYIGGGNTGRNTTIVRSNYLLEESVAIFEHSLKLWEGLSQELNFNLMFSQRGVYNLGHNLQDMRAIERRVNANRLMGIDAYVASPEDIKAHTPLIDISPKARYPILGASYQPRGGVARHDAVAWGFARAAGALGVDIIQNCEVSAIEISNDKVEGVQTSKGYVKTNKLGAVVAGHASVVAAMAGVRLPIISHPLQAFVSEPMKPMINTVIMSGAVHGYISQSDKGDLVIGAGIDGYPGYGQRGSPHIIEHTAQAIIELFPALSRVRMNRQWGGIVDTTPDVCPIISKTKVKGFYVNCGWGTGGFKATPGSGNVFAHTIANDEPHPINEPFNLDRFVSGKLIDEHGAAGVAH